MDCGYLSLSTTYTTLDTLQLYQGNPLYSEVLLEMKLESSTYPSGLLECQNFHRFEVSLYKTFLEKEHSVPYYGLNFWSEIWKGMQRLKNCENSWRDIYIFKAILTSDQALFSFRFENNIR